ncbi:MAG: Crp/Fnr family transcriptional regulator [Myxococcales bacterium]|nr:Crp/Fnr family transcriptional regulator [Myxococcales bacterium]
MDPVALLRKNALFQGLDGPLLERVALALRRHEYARGEHVWDEGDPAVALFFVASGQLKTYRNSRAGGQIITQVIVASEAFGHPGLFITERRRGTTAEALEPSVCYSLSRDVLVEIMHEHPPLMQRMLETIAQMCWNLTTVLTDVTFQDIRRRVARMLLALSESHGAPGPEGVRIGMKLSQGTLAGLVGASRENVNRALAYFVTNGDVRHEDGYFTVLRAESLREEI